MLNINGLEIKYHKERPQLQCNNRIVIEIDMGFLEIHLPMDQQMGIQVCLHETLREELQKPHSLEVRGMNNVVVLLDVVDEESKLL